MHKLRIATRRSALAVTQTKLAAEEIVRRNSGVAAGALANTPLDYELVELSTEGDRRLDRPLSSFGGKGVFVKELEVALLEHRADIAVHSLKDMPAELLPQFKLAAVLKREDPRDCFIAKGGAGGVMFMDLPAGSRVGTGSVRRVVQLKEIRPDLEYVPIRGNIQTRIAKLSELDGVVLAAAGLKRMGLDDLVTEYFDAQKMLPASGQGILAIETLLQPSLELEQILARANDARTYNVAVAEMAFLKALNAGCQYPVAAHAEYKINNSFNNVACKNNVVNIDNVACKDNVMCINGIYWFEPKQVLLRARVEGECATDEQARELGCRLASKIAEQF